MADLTSTMENDWPGAFQQTIEALQADTQDQEIFRDLVSLILRKYPPAERERRSKQMLVAVARAAKYEHGQEDLDAVLQSGLSLEAVKAAKSVEECDALIEEVEVDAVATGVDHKHEKWLETALTPQERKLRAEKIVLAIAGAWIDQDITASVTLEQLMDQLAVTMVKSKKAQLAAVSKVIVLAFTLQDQAAFCDILRSPAQPQQPGWPFSMHRVTIAFHKDRVQLWSCRDMFCSTLDALAMFVEAEHPVQRCVARARLAKQVDELLMSEHFGDVHEGQDFEDYVIDANETHWSLYQEVLDLLVFNVNPGQVVDSVASKMRKLMDKDVRAGRAAKIMMDAFSPGILLKLATSEATQALSEVSPGALRAAVKVLAATPGLKTVYSVFDGYVEGLRDGVAVGFNGLKIVERMGDAETILTVPLYKLMQIE